MNHLNSSQKSPVSSLFSSVFKREDIHNRKNSDHQHTRSASHHIESILSKHEIFDRSEDLQKTSNVTSNEVHSKVESAFNTKENFSKFNVKEDFEYNNEMKYSDLAKRYERMQDFYKTQVSRLTEEVNHYKTLYHKLMIQQSAERKLIRKSFIMISFLRARGKTIAKFVALPYVFYLGLKYYDQTEEWIIEYLVSETRKIVKKELKQPFLIETGTKSFKNVLISSVLESERSKEQTAALIARLLKHKESKNFGVLVANNLINKKWLKQMVLDLIRSYQSQYNFDLFLPENFDGLERNTPE